MAEAKQVLFGKLLKATDQKLLKLTSLDPESTHIGADVLFISF